MSSSCARSAVLAVVVVGSWLVALGPASVAGASCASPMFEPIDPVVRGGPATISGRAFGDNCYDTGPPPEGEGVLGVPISDIEVVIEQNGTEVVVARGDADDEYAFTVDVWVPTALAPGPAQVIARWDRHGGGRAEADIEVLPAERNGEPTGTTPVASFQRATGAALSEDDVATDGLPTRVIGGVFLVVVVGVVLITVVVPRVRARRRTMSSDR